MKIKFLTSGNVLMSPPDQETYEYLINIQQIEGKPVQLKQTGQGTNKGILMKYPVLMPLKPILDHPQILKAKRCRIYSGEETRQIEITVQGHLPEFLQLGSWGTFYTRPYSREPLRCYNCQRYGHHKNSCNLETRCGVCAGPHKTELCITKHKEEQETTLKCPNCKETHLAWSKACTARRALVDTQKETQREFMTSFRPALSAKSNWGGQREQAQDTPRPSTLPTNKDFSALGQGAIQKHSPHQPRTRLETPPLRQMSEEEEEQISLTKSELKDLFTSFTGALAGMLGHTVQEEKLNELADKVLESKLKKRSGRSQTKKQHPHPPPQPQPQPPAPGTTQATAAIEAEKKALGLPTTHPKETSQTTRTTRQHEHPPTPETHAPAHQPETLRILQWNINGLRGRQHLLTADAQAKHRDVILLQETTLPEDTTLKIRGYKAYHSPAVEGQSRGCSIFVRDVIPSKRVENPIQCGENVEVIAVNITLRHLDLQIYNIYNGPRSINFDISEILATCASTHTFIGGDFNAHHETLGSKSRNRSGHHIAEAMANIPEARLLNSGEATHIAGGILDLSFVSQNSSSGRKMGNTPSPGKRPLRHLHKTQHPPARKTNTHTQVEGQRSKLVPLQGHLPKEIANIPESNTIDEMEARLTTTFHQAADTAIPKTKPTNRNHKDRWYYNADVKQYNHRINQARKLNRKHNTDTTRKLLCAAISIARKATRRIRTEKWLEWSASWSPHTRIGEMWRNVRLASGKAPSRQPLHPDPTSEANRLIDSFAARSSPDQLPQGTSDRQNRLEIERSMAVCRACLADAPTDTPFTQRELLRTLRPRKDTAAGTDKIAYSMFREAGTEAHHELLRVINTSYDTGKLPASWKQANIVPIPKPNDPGNHRPISLLSCLGKTAEKMVLTHLQWAMGDTHKHIYAFTANKETRDCITEMLITIADKKAIHGPRKSIRTGKRPGHIGIPDQTENPRKASKMDEGLPTRKKGDGQVPRQNLTHKDLR